MRSYLLNSPGDVADDQPLPDRLEDVAGLPVGQALHHHTID